MKIVIDGFSEKSLKDAARRVERYQNEIMDKNREFVEALCNAGLQVMYNNLVGAGDSQPPVPQSPHVKVDVTSGDILATLVLRGKDVAFVEFGAGVYYNGAAGRAPNPLGDQFGFVIGSYGLGKGKKPLWHYWDEESGHYKTSRGTEATMPMYKADMEIRQTFFNVAKQVFGG